MSHPLPPPMPEEHVDFTRENRGMWDATSAAYQAAHRIELEDDLLWGPSMPLEAELAVLGDVADKDVLQLGCGGGQSAVHLARRGARVVGVDFSARQVEYARAYSAQERAAVRFIEANVEDLSTLPAGSFDIAFSAYALGFVKRVDRVFREASRVLRAGGRFAFSWWSPFYDCISLAYAGGLLVTTSYFDRAPRIYREASGPRSTFTARTGTGTEA